MIEVNEQLAEVISNSRVAFINGQMAEAFKLAKEAIKLDENCADAYQCAANVCMSLSRYEDAIEYYQKAVNCDPNNGNRYFSLGYAQASVNKIAEAMHTFTIGAIVRHFKREYITDPQSAEYLYKILAFASHTETGEKLVIYQALYPPYKTCARPYDMFISEVDHVKYPDIKQKYRFEVIETDLFPQA